MSWNDLTLNPRVLLGYFNYAPSLEGIEIQNISLQSQGSTVEIVFEPAQFPERPSTKWDAGSNTCQITLRAIGVTGFEISGWNSLARGNLNINKSPKGIYLQIEGKASLRATCEFIDITKVTGYINGRA